MQLVGRIHGRRDVPQEQIAEIRDAGGRLEYLVSRYERLVRDLLRDLAPSAELQSRLRLLNREIGLLALSIQDLMLAKGEGLPEYSTERAGRNGGVVASA